MPTAIRASGLTITAPDTYRIEDGASDTAGAASIRRGPGAGRGSRPVPMPTEPPGGGASEPDALLEALQQQDFEVIDRIELKPELEPTPVDGRRRAAAPPVPSQQQADVEIAVDADEDAVLLVEQDGMYTWNLPTSREAVAPSDARIRRGRGRRALKFTIEVRATRAAGASPRRGLVSEIVYDRIKVYALKFVARVAIGSGVRFLERNVRRGLVAMNGLDPAEWNLARADDVKLPTDRPARILLFVHGTFSSTIGSFGALCGTPWGQALFEAAAAEYDAVLGFDHATLSDDPVTNATELLRALEALDAQFPPRLDVVAFSRGGLVFRTLVEHLLPRSTLKCRIRRGVFVGCTNAGTLLAAPENWGTLIDLYTNLAVGAFRLLTLLPQAASAALILREVVSGLGAFVKYLATSATGDVPGLAAMQPTGEFITTLNSRQPDQPEPGTIEYFAVTSEFEPSLGGETHEPRELPPRLLLSLADGLVDRVMGEPNDLVVNTSSMTAIDHGVGTYVRDTLAFGRTPHVYHTSYFARPEVVNAMARWLALPAPPASISRTRRAGVEGPGVWALPAIPAPRDIMVPALADTDVLTVDATTLADEAAASIERELPSYVIVRRRLEGEWLHYAFDADEVLHLAHAAPGQVLANALQLHETDRSREQPVHAVTAAPGGSGALPTRRGVVMIGDEPVGVVPEPAAMASRHVTELARMATSAASSAERVIARRIMPTLASTVDREGGAAGLASELALGTGGRARSMRTAGSGLGTRSRSLRLIDPLGIAPVETVPCHFLAEMPPEVLLNHTATIEVTLSREVTAALAGTAAAASGAIEIDAGGALVVQVVPRTNFALVDSEPDRIEVQPPAPDEPVALYFNVKAVHAGKAEVWILVTQRQMAIATLVLNATVVERASAARARRVTARAESAAAPPQTMPLDQLNVVEQTIGNTVQYVFELELPSVNVFERRMSDPLKGARDEYVNTLYKEIEDRYISHYNTATRTADVEAFTAELRAYGAVLFDQLFPQKIQELLWTHRDKLTSIRVVSTEPFIPWEIIHLREPGEPVDLAGPQRFLAQMGLVRWLHNVNGLPPTTLRVREGRARYVIPDYPHPDWKLAETTSERLYLERRFAATAVVPQPGPVQAALTAPGTFDLLHFACHGEAESAAIAHARVLLEGRVEGGNYVPTYLKASNVESYARLRGADGVQPIVFLNACQAGRAGYQLTGMGGFAQAFLRAGAGAFISSLWSVGDEPAFLFGEAFYDALLNGYSVSEATVAARAAACRDDATWLAYAVYAHPHARLTR